MRVLIAIAAAIALALPAGAGAYYGWHWSRVKTENYLVNQRSTSDGEDIIDATCQGYGMPMRRNGVRLYARFTCWEQDALYREFKVRVRPVSAYRARVLELYCNDSESEYACP